MYTGSIIPIIKETPRITTFRVAARSMLCMKDIPRTVINPKTAMPSPPITGVGMADSTAPNFPNTPLKMNKSDMIWKTNRLPTWKVKHKVVQYMDICNMSASFHNAVKMEFMRDRTAQTPVTRVVAATLVYVVVAWQAPSKPDRMLLNPSMRIPLFSACFGGIGTPQTSAIA